MRTGTRTALGLAAILAALAAPAHAQDGESPEEWVVPPPPATSAPSVPAAPLVGGVPLDLIVSPLLIAADADLAAGRIALALGRATIVAEALPEGLPLRVRADGLRVLASQRLPEGTPPAPLDQVLAPLIAQAELDLRARQPQIALPRLDFALARLPAGAVMAPHAHALRRHAAAMIGAPPSPPPATPAPPRGSTPREPPRDGRRGTAEMVELYISAAALGAITGAYIPFMAAEGTATGTTYVLTTIAGAGLLAVGVLTLDLTMRIPSGVPPTISASIRFGLGMGVLSIGLYETSSVAPGDPEVSFSLAWGGMMVGALVGLGVGFGLTPTVAEARFVESMGYWGAALGTFIAMMSDYQDPVAGFGLTLGGVDAGLLLGMVLVALEIVPPIGRTLWLDLGFFVGSGLGAAIPGLYFAYTDEPIEIEAIGVGMAVGAIGGWALTYLLTDGMGAPEPSEPPVALGVAPVEGGAALAVSGTF